MNRSIGEGPTLISVPRQPHVIAFDDAAFAREHRGDVMLVGVVYSGLRLDGIETAQVRRDGANATRVISDLVLHSPFGRQLHAVLLQGIAVAGFNVIDIRTLHATLALPVIVVARRQPNLTAIRSALLDHVRGGRKKWKLIEQAGPMEKIAGVWTQRAGIPARAVELLLRPLCVHGQLPEPIRTAHLIARSLGARESPQRA